MSTTTITNKNETVPACPEAAGSAVPQEIRALPGAVSGLPVQDGYAGHCDGELALLAKKPSKPIVQRLFAPFAKEQIRNEIFLKAIRDVTVLSGFELLLPPRVQEEVGKFLTEHADFLPFPLNLAAVELGKTFREEEMPENSSHKTARPESSVQVSQDGAPVP